MVWSPQARELAQRDQTQRPYLHVRYSWSKVSSNCSAKAVTCGILELLHSLQMPCMQNFNHIIIYIYIHVYDPFYEGIAEWNERLEFDIPIQDIPRGAKLCFILFAAPEK